MAIEIGTCATVEEMRKGISPIFHFFGQHEPSDESIDRFGRVMRPERVHTASEDGTVVGGAAAFAFELTVPGGRVPAAGVTVVGVLPTHRRRGILRSLMRAQLDDVRERGEPVAYLWASEASIYGRFGYGIASLAGEVDIRRPYSAFAAPAEPYGRARLVSHEEALELFPVVYDAVAAGTPGMFARSREWWDARVLADAEWRRAGGGEMVRVVLEANGEPDAYALYRLHVAFEGGVSTGKTSVIEALARSPEGTRAIWRYLLDVDWMDRVTGSLLTPDHPLLLLVAEPRRLNLTVGDALWVRLVDVRAALAGRTFAAGDAVVLDVADEFCPWNAGRYRVGETVERTDDPADLGVDVTALGSVYLGGFTFAQLARALRVEELRPGGIERADTLFRTDRLPWCPEIF
jgi:predicted acetyltransferase